VNGGYYQGNQVPEDVRNLPVAVPVGTQTLHAAGLGYAIKYRQRDEVVMVFFGDGATSEGDFHEAMNFAGVFQTPVVFVCQNNHWAISVPREHQTRSKTLAQKAIAYGIPSIQVDGNDPLAVYIAAQEAVNRARSGDGPGMIECVTYRLSLHTTADDPSHYRTDEEVEEWEKRDPFIRFQKYLIDKGLLSEEDIDSLETEIKAEIQEAVDSAEEQMKVLSHEPLSMFDYIFAEMPPFLEEQRSELKALIGEQAETGGEA
jgi:pyruvate dehydrogenase E1 component alpha subunit